jgi:hypothetical protein
VALNSKCAVATPLGFAGVCVSVRMGALVSIVHV